MSLKELPKPRETKSPPQAGDETGSLAQDNVNPPLLHLTLAADELCEKAISQKQLIQTLYFHDNGDINESSPHLLGH